MTRKRILPRTAKKARGRPRLEVLSSGRGLDPLKDKYHDSIIEAPDRFSRRLVGHTALLCIDMQYLDAAPGCGLFEDVTASGVPLEAQQYYFQRLEQVVLPNVRALQDAFRAQGREVIHVRIQSLTRNGRDRSPGHKRLHLLAPPGSKEAEFLEEVAPHGDEIIINKTASGVFTSTNLTYVLRNLGIGALYVAGVYTNECVSTTVRDASDLGFFVNLVSDGCATVTEQLQESTIATLKDRYARVVTAQEALAEIGAPALGVAAAP